MAKYKLKDLFRKEQHIEILKHHKDDTKAANAYNSLLKDKVVSRQLVRYWRKIYIDNNGSQAKANNQLKEQRKLVRPSPTDDIGTETYIPEMSNRILCIGDLHEPYTHQDAYAFLEHVRDWYKPDTVVQIGDECFPPSAEIMTECGWMSLGEYVDTNCPLNVLQVHDDLSSSFVYPQRNVKKPFKGNLLEYSHKTMYSLTTPKHNLVKQNPRTGTLHRREAWDSKGTDSWYIPRTTTLNTSKVSPLNENELRLAVAFQADGTLTKGAMRFEFSKERKATRLKELLGLLGLSYSTHNTARGTYQYYIKVADTPTYINKSLRIALGSPLCLSLEQREIVLDELKYWDSTDKGSSYRYISSIMDNVQYVQELAVLTGLSTSVIGSTSDGTNTSHYVNVLFNRENCSLKSATVKEVPYEGYVYCVTVDSGMILVRQNGHVSVSGNCDGHAISFHDSDPNLDSAGVELEKAKVGLEKLHTLFPNLLLCDSNHGSLIYRRAKAHGLPIQMIKKYREILFPEHKAQGWSWADAWVLNTPMGAVRFQHQVAGDLMLNASHERTNLVIGHFHGKLDITYAASSSALYFGAHTGCLIDNKSLAFAYGKLSRNKPILGCLVITDGCPQIIPMLLDSNGRWVGVTGEKSE